jgi:hypothetical protein
MNSNGLDPSGVESDAVHEEVRRLVRMLVPPTNRNAIDARSAYLTPLAATRALAGLGTPGIEALTTIVRNWAEYNLHAYLMAIQALGESGHASSLGAPSIDLSRAPNRGARFFLRARELLV